MENFELTIDVNGTKITGSLDGSSKHWIFKSDNPYFKSFYPNGVISSYMYHTKEEIEKPETGLIFNAICDEIHIIENRS